MKAQTWCLEACLPGQQTWLGEFSAPLQAPHLQNGASGGPATKANQQMILVHGQGLGVQVRVCAAPGATPSERCANWAGRAVLGALANKKMRAWHLERLFKWLSLPRATPRPIYSLMFQVVNNSAARVRLAPTIAATRLPFQS